MIIAWIYFLHFVLFLLPGMAAAVYARRFYAAHPGNDAPQDDELSATLIGACLVGYVVFWVYFMNPLYGKITSLIIVALSLTVVCAPAGRETFFTRKYVPGYWLPLGLMLMAGVLYLGLCFLYGGYDDAFTLSGQRFIYPFFVSDHYLPATFADKILQGDSLCTLDPNSWKTSDRPPLQCGLWLLHSFFTVWDHNLDYLITGMILQTIWIPGLMVFLRRFRIASKSIVIIYLFIIFGGMSLFNTTFPWPKLLPAGLIFVAIAYFVQDAGGYSARIRAGLFGGTAFGLALLGHTGSLFALPAIGIILLFMKRLNLAMIAAAVLATAALMAPWVAYQHFVDPPGNNIAMTHLAGVYDLADERPLVEAVQHSYAKLTAKEIISHKKSNLLSLFGDVFQGPREWSIIPRDARHLFRDGSYCSLFWAFGLLNLGFAFLGFFHRHDQSKRRERRIAIILLVAGGITVGLWILVLFGPGTASIHHGTHFVPLAMMTALALLIANVSRRLALALAGINLALFYWVYVFLPDVPSMPDTTMLTIALLAFAGIMGMLYWEYCQADNVARPWRPSAIAGLLATVCVLQGAFVWLIYSPPYGLRVTYYKNNFEQQLARGIARQLSGSYAVTPPAGGVPRENFSARFKGMLRVPETATYTFKSQSDDGFRLIIDGDPVIENWRHQQWDASHAIGRRFLTMGDHPIRADYFNGRDEGAFCVWWSGGTVPQDTILAAPFLRRR